MLDDRKMKAIELHMKGMQNPEISKQIGVSRQTVWTWLTTDEEVKSELDRLKRENHLHIKNRIATEADMALDTVVYLALHGHSEKVRGENAQYILDRYDGKPTTKVEQNTKDDKKDNVSADLLEQTVKEVDNETSENPESK